MTCMVLRTAWSQRQEEVLAGAVRPHRTASTRCTFIRAKARDTAICWDERERGDEEHAPLVGTFSSSSSQPFPRVAALGSVKQEPSRADVVLAAVLMLVVIISGTLRFHMHACRQEV